MIGVSIFLILFVFPLIVLSTDGLILKTNSNPDPNINTSNQDVPQSSQATSFNRVQLREDFSSDPTTHWSFASNGPSSLTTYWSYDAANDAVLLSSETGDTNLYYYSMTYVVDLSQAGDFVNARMSVDWEMTLPTLEDADYVCWQYSVGNGGSTWNNFTSSINTVSLTRTTQVWDLSELGLTGTETEIYIRMYAYLRRILSSTPSEVTIYSVEIMTFESNITDNSDATGNINSIQNVDVSLSIVRGGAESGLTTYTTDYVLYYSYSSSAVSDTNNDGSIVSSGSFTGDVGSLTFSIPVTQDNTHVYYTIYYHDPTAGYYYKTPVLSVYVYDGITPIYNSISRNITNDDLSYNDDLLITVDVTDVGGSNLERLYIYWGTDTDPSSSNNIGSDFYIWNTSTTTDVINFVIPSKDLSPLYSIYARLYLYDGHGNLNVSDYLNITAHDFIAPTVTYIDNGTQDDKVEYFESFYLEYNIYEDPRGIGVAPGSEGLYLCYVSNRNASNATDYDGTISVSHSAYPGLIYIYVNVSLYFSLGDNISFWLIANDSAGNWNSTFDYIVNFTVVDTVGPFIVENEGSSSLAPINYVDNRTFEIRIYEPAGGAGVNTSSIHFYYRLNNDTFDYDAVLELTSIGEFNNVWYFLLTNDAYKYGDTIYIWIEALDNFKNIGWLNTSVAVVDLVKPEISLLSDYPDSNYTIARTHYDLAIAVNAYDDSKGSLLKDVRMIYSIDTQPSWSNYSFYILGNLIGDNEYQFIIPKENLTEGTLYYSIRAYDNAGNYKELTSSATILEQRLPHLLAYSLGGDPDEYLNTGTFDFTFNISENCIMFVYLNDTLQNEHPYVGISFKHHFDLKKEGEYHLKVSYYNQTWNYICYVDWTAPNKINASTIQISYENGEVHLKWAVPEGSENEKLTYFIFRGTDPDFNATDIGRAINVGTSDTTEFVDKVPSSGVYYYKIYARDAAGNTGELSDAVSIEVSAMNSTTYMVIGALVLGVGATSVIVVKKKRAAGETLSEKGLSKKFLSESDEKKASKTDSLWEDLTSDVEEETEWVDIGQDAVLKKKEPAPTGSQPSYGKSFAGASTSSLASSSAQSTVGAPTTPSRGMGTGSGDVISRFDPEMRELYRDAEEFAEMGQESMAAQSYEMLLRLAEKRGDAEIIQFIKKKLDDLYK